MRYLLKLFIKRDSFLRMFFMSFRGERRERSRAMMVGGEWRVISHTRKYYCHLYQEEVVKEIEA